MPIDALAAAWKASSNQLAENLELSEPRNHVPPLRLSPTLVDVAGTADACQGSACKDLTWPLPCAKTGKSRRNVAYNSQDLKSWHLEVSAAAAAEPGSCPALE